MSDPHPFSDVEQRVRSAWEARCGLRRGPLEQADVDAIAEAAFALDGVKPTVEFIRRIAGGGSPNTIHPKLDAWFRQGRQAAGPSAVPTELLALWERLRADATSVAQDALAPMRAAIADDRAALAAEAAQLASDQAAVASERATTERLVTAMREEFRTLQASNETLRATVSELHIDVGEKAEAIERLEHALDVSKQARSRDARELSEAKVAMTTLEEAAETHVAALRETRDVLHASQAHGAMLEEMLEAAAAARSDADQRLAALAAERDAARSESTEQAQRAKQLEHALQIAQASATSDTALREHLTSEVQRERLTSSQAQAAGRHAAEALVASEATATGYKEEIDRLHALLQKAAHGERDQPRRNPRSQPK